MTPPSATSAGLPEHLLDTGRTPLSKGKSEESARTAGRMPDNRPRRPLSARPRPVSPTSRRTIPVLPGSMPLPSALGPRSCRARRRPQPTGPAQDRREQRPGHGHLSQLERQGLGTRDHLRPDLDQLLSQGRQAPVLHLAGQRQLPQEDPQVAKACGEVAPASPARAKPPCRRHGRPAWRSTTPDLFHARPVAYRSPGRSQSVTSMRVMIGSSSAAPSPGRKSRSAWRIQGRRRRAM